MTPVEVTPVLSLKRQYPHVDNISDWRAQQSIRLLWDRVFALEEQLVALRETQGDLVSAANAQEDQIARVQQATGEALAELQITLREAGEAAGGPSTMPNYSAIAHAAESKFVSLVVPIAEEEDGKAQLTRQIAWDIYQVDTRIRLFEKTSGAHVYDMSTDLVVLGTDGSWADVATAKDNGDGTVTIKSRWGDGGPDANTSQEDRWIVPTEAIAMLDGPMTRV